MPDGKSSTPESGWPSSTATSRSTPAGSGPCTHHPIEIKTTGQIIDELQIAELRLLATRHPPDRMLSEIRELERAIEKRVSGSNREILLTVDAKRGLLRRHNRLIWELIDLVMAGKHTADTAFEIQSTNAKRREVVRQIDQLLGERHLDSKVYPL